MLFFMNVGNWPEKCINNPSTNTAASNHSETLKSWLKILKA